jgi:hypothetical protein
VLTAGVLRRTCGTSRYSHETAAVVAGSASPPESGAAVTIPAAWSPSFWRPSSARCGAMLRSSGAASAPATVCDGAFSDGVAAAVGSTLVCVSDAAASAVPAARSALMMARADSWLRPLESPQSAAARPPCLSGLWVGTHSEVVASLNAGGGRTKLADAGGGASASTGFRCLSIAGAASVSSRLTEEACARTMYCEPHYVLLAVPP